MLRIHFMQQWFGLSDPAMEEALHEVPLYREFAGLDAGATRMPDESTILRFGHLLEEHDLSLLLRQSPTDRAVEAGQGQHPGQGGASVSGDQAPVRFHEGALPGLGQENGAVGHAVCAEQFVDGQEANSSGDAGMSAPAVRANARDRAEKAQSEEQIVPHSGVDWVANSSCEFVHVSSRYGGAYADHPKRRSAFHGTLKANCLSRIQALPEATIYSPLCACAMAYRRG
jgi:hypothetical protein